MTLILNAAPGSEPVTLTEAKSHLRVTDSNEDTLINSLISAARNLTESFTNRALITQTWDLKLQSFGQEISIPNPPLVSVTSIQYVDIDEATQTLATTEYAVLNAGAHIKPGRIVPAYNKSWPSVRGMPNDITIRFVAGYGAASSVPPQLRWAVLLILSELYARRESAIVGSTIMEVPYSASALMAPYVVHSF